MSLAANIGNNFPSHYGPVALCVVGDSRLGGADTVRQLNFSSLTAMGLEIKRPTTIMPFNIDCRLATLKSDVVGMEARLQPAMLKKGGYRFY